MFHIEIFTFQFLRLKSDRLGGRFASLLVVFAFVLNWEPRASGSPWGALGSILKCLEGSWGGLGKVLGGVDAVVFLLRCCCSWLLVLVSLFFCCFLSLLKVLLFFFLFFFLFLLLCFGFRLLGLLGSHTGTSWALF